MPPQGFVLRVMSLNILIAYLEVDDRREGKFATFSKLFSFKKKKKTEDYFRFTPPPPSKKKKKTALQIYKFNEVT